MNIYGLTIEKLQDYLKEKGEKPFRATQIFEWLYREKVDSFSKMTNVKKDFINVLEKDFKLKLLKLVLKQASDDKKTVKFLFELEDKNLIEAVLMKHDYGNSLCVTTQVGCNMGCKFCASGLLKKVRNLEIHEIVLQVLSVSVLLNIRISHVVVMGIGEPFDNYDNLIDFINIINYSKGLEIGARHISVSTCGIVPKIYQFASEKLQSNLAISLHGSNDEIRNKLMPINKKYNLKSLIGAIKDYIEETNRRVTIEYILVDSINDKIEHAKELALLLRGLNVYVNLIPYNEVAESGLKRSLKENMNRFYDKLKKEKINVTLRKEFGGNIDAACGQLRSKIINPKDNILGLKQGVVILENHNEKWQEEANLVINRLKDIFNDKLTNIAHIGSTSIYGIKAKPVIDIALCVDNLSDIIPLIPMLEKEGFNHIKENDRDWQIFFSSKRRDLITHHIHIIKTNSEEWYDYLFVRDFLNENPHIAKEYEDLKVTLKKEYEFDRAAYTEKKADFIQKILQKRK